MHKTLHLIICLLLYALPLNAQWSGSLELSGGLGGMKGNEVNDEKPMYHGHTQGIFQLNYKTEKFSWSTVLEGKWTPNTTDNARLSYKNGKLGVVLKAASTQPLSTRIKSDFVWTPSSDRNYSTWIQYQLKNDRASNHSLNFDGDLEEMQKFSYYYETPYLDNHNIQTGFRSRRSFHSGRRILQSSISAEFDASQKINLWKVFKAGDIDGSGGIAVNEEDVEGYFWEYWITPSSFNLNLDGDIHLQNTVLDGETKLKLTPGIRAASRHALDINSGATWSEFMHEWRDSTSIMEVFNYLSVRAEPYLAADFVWKSIEAHADYACQVYGRSLTSDKYPERPFQVKGVYPVGKAQVKWTISPNHSLALKNEMSVSHPDYLKICWYDRTAGYLDQLYRGNDQLRSPQTRLYGIDYEFKYKRFISKTGISYKRIVDEIDQTWSNMVIENREYKVFEWLNSSDSHSFGASQTLGWRGKVITANVGVTYNQSRRTSRKTGAVKNSFDWRLTSDVTARLGKGWSIGADAKYQSKVATFFTIFKQYCELNAYVQKEFKKFTLYFQGRDLLDQVMETSFESEETKEYWIEQVRNNRRIFVLGAKWKF